MRLLAFLLFSTVAVAQQSATTSAPCSPIAENNSGSITINCPGISKEEGRKMLAILNKILVNQIDPEVVMVKLDEIQHGVTTIESQLAEKQRQEDEAEKKRRTAPLLSVSLTPLAPGKLNLCIISNNLIPYEFRYAVMNSKNTIIGGFPIEMSKVYPTKDDATMCIPKDIDLKTLTDHIIKVSFTFKSLTFDELHLPNHAGTAELTYRISDDFTTLTYQQPK